MVIFFTISSPFLSFPDWAQIEDDDSDDDNHSQYSDQPEENRPQSQEQVQEPQNQPENPSVQTESRPYVHRGSGEGRGNRGDRRPNRGRENRGDRNNRRENREGPRQGQGGDRPKPPMESQPKQEMLNLIKRQRDTTTMITVFNVAFNSTIDDVKALYPEVKFRSAKEVKPGVFIFDLDQDEALRFTEIGGKTLHGREFFIKLSYENQANYPDQYPGGGRSDKYDKPRRGGGGGPGGDRRPNNRREYNQDRDNYKPKGENYNKDRPQDYGNKRPQYNRDRDHHTHGPSHTHTAHHDFRRAEPAQIDTDNKFFRNHDLQAGEFNIRFTKSASVTHKVEDISHENLPKPPEFVQTQSTEPKVAKPNPFGDAKPRDEFSYLKKKEEEKKHDDEDKKPVQQAPPKFEPKIIQKPPVVEAKPIVEAKPEVKPEVKSEVKAEEPAVTTTQKPEYEKKQDRRQDRPYKDRKDNYYEKRGGGNYGGGRQYNNNNNNNNPPNQKDEEVLNDYDDEYDNGNDDYASYANAYKNYQKSSKYDRYDEQGEGNYEEGEDKYAEKRQDKNPLQISHYRSEGGHQKPRGYGRGGRGGGRGGSKRGGGAPGAGFSQVIYEEKPRDKPQYTKKNSYNEGNRKDDYQPKRDDNQQKKDDANKGSTPVNKGQQGGRRVDKFNVFDHFDIKKE